MPNQHSPGAVTFSVELACEVLERLALGETVRQICRDDHMPDQSSVLRWQSKAEVIQWPEVPGLESGAFTFAHQYARARQLGYENMADELIDIAANGSNDWIDRETEKGRIQRVTDHEHINRSRLRVDTTKWLMSKALPKQYGDSTRHEHSGPEGGPIKLGMDEFVSKLNAIASRASTDEGSEGEAD